MSSLSLLLLAMSLLFFSQNIWAGKETLNTKEKKILTAIEQLQRRIQLAAKERFEIELKLGMIEENITQTENEMKQIEASFKTNRRLFLQNYFLNRSLKSKNVVDHLLIAKNPAELDRRIYLIHQLSEVAAQSAEQNLKSLEEIEKKKKNLEKQQERQKVLISLGNENEEKLEKELKLQEALLQKMKHARLFVKKSQIQIKKILKENGKNENLLNALFENNIASMKGQLDLPVQGRLQKHYGYQQQSQEYLNFPVQGTFIAVDSDESVRSILQGKVLWREFIPGLGETIIFDHGRDFLSLVSGLKAVTVQVGEVVEKHQLIGMPAESIYHGRQGIYFELRQFGEPLALHRWIKPEQRKLTQ